MASSRARTCCGSHPSSRTADLLLSSAWRKSQSRKGLTSPAAAQASHSAWPTLSRLGTTDTCRLSCTGAGASCSSSSGQPAVG